MKKTIKAIIISVSSALVLGVCSFIFIPKIIDYMNDHPFPPEVVPNKIHIACIGDSITWGAGVWNDRDNSTYEVLLNEKLGENYQVLNYGLNGRTLLNEGDMPYGVEPFYQISHDIQADKYIIMLGSNDSKPHNWQYSGIDGEVFKTQLKIFLQSYIDLPNCPDVYVMQPPKAYPVDGKIPWSISDETIKNEVCPYIKDVGEELNVKVIDLYAISENHSEWFPDGVHPNRDGNIAIANKIYSEIFG